MYGTKLWKSHDDYCLGRLSSLNTPGIPSILYSSYDLLLYVLEQTKSFTTCNLLIYLFSFLLGKKVNLN